MENNSENKGNILRPTMLSNYVGQEHMKKKLNIILAASKKRLKDKNFSGSVLDHILFSGPPGLGKTTISSLIAKEIGVGMVSHSAPAIEKSGDLLSILLNINPNDIIFLDEIHRLPTYIEETLYSAMEDFEFSIFTDVESSKEPITISLPPFTLIGATTRPGLLSSPLRDRFGIHEQLKYYSSEELSNIVELASIKVGFSDISKIACDMIGSRARGTPRIALKMMKRLQDYSLSHKDNLKNKEGVENALNVMTGVDDNGLDEKDKCYLEIISRYGPVGIKNISSMLSEDIMNIEDYIEPFLMKKGYILKTNRGRVITNKGTDLLNLYIS